jgi:hypothetical protein
MLHSFGTSKNILPVEGFFSPPLEIAFIMANQKNKEALRNGTGAFCQNLGASPFTVSFRLITLSARGMLMDIGRTEKGSKNS